MANGVIVGWLLSCTVCPWDLAFRDSFCAINWANEKFSLSSWIAWWRSSNDGVVATGEKDLELRLMLDGLNGRSSCDAISFSMESNTVKLLLSITLPSSSTRHAMGITFEWPACKCQNTTWPTRSGQSSSSWLKVTSLALATASRTALHACSLFTWLRTHVLRQTWQYGVNRRYVPPPPFFFLFTTP